MEFLSTLSLRRATTLLDGAGVDVPDFYPRSPCGERQGNGVKLPNLQNFYPRSPCGERRTVRQQVSHHRYFYPRSPCGERPKVSSIARVVMYFYPRSPCGERLLSGLANILVISAISIHALLAESDIGPQVVADRVGISIHALLAESDGHFADRHRQLYHFYPRSPCGERRTRGPTPAPISAFLSTLSLRRATRLLPVPQAWQPNFYPRSPCGERRRIPVNIMLLLDFYPRSPCGERQDPISSTSDIYKISIHALLAESDTETTCTLCH